MICDETIQAAMQRLASAKAMQAMDERAVNTLGLPARVLMENAACALVENVLALWQTEEQSKKRTWPKVVVCCGAGGNGGDGYAAARLLVNRGCDVTLVALQPPRHVATMENAQAWRHFGGVFNWDVAKNAASQALDTADVVVDAVFGIGLNRAVEAKAATLILAMNQSLAKLKIAADIPSGIHADTGAVLGVALQATHTLQFQVPKQGVYLLDGALHAGKLLLADISIPSHWPEDAPKTWRITTTSAAKLLPQRPPQAHKGTFGRSVLLCGSKGMGGAALLAASAALRTGSGLVTLGTPRCLLNAALADQPEVMQPCPTRGDEAYFDAQQVDFFAQIVNTQTALAFGCGVGRHAQTADFIRGLLQRVQLPMVVDADGLYHMSAKALAQYSAPCIVTPHPGEFAQLFGVSVPEQAQNILLHARKAALQSGVVVVLKGASTVVASPDGRAFINDTGDVGLASAGSGDVLTGILCALLAQGMPTLWAAVLGVHLHGLARNVLAQNLHAAYFSAGDLLTGLNLALQQLADKQAQTD